MVILIKTLNSSSVFLPPTLIYCASVQSLPVLSFMVPILAWNTLLITPVFLKRSLVFPILLFSSISLHCSFKKSLLSFFAFLWNSAFSWVYLSLSPLLFASLLSSYIYKASSDNHFNCFHFCFLGWFWSLPPVRKYEPLPIVLHAFCLPDLILWIYSPPLYNLMDFSP